MSTEAKRSTVMPGRWFFSVMAIALIVTVAWGFGPSFYFSRFMARAPSSYLDPGGQPGSRLFVAHGLTFTAWLALFALQTALIAVRKPALHRRLGVAALIVAPLVVVSGVAVTLHAGTNGFHDVPIPAATFLIVPLIDIVLFAGFVTLGLVTRRNPATHKRSMLLASIVICEAATARVALFFPWIPPSFNLALLLLLPLLVWDAVTLRRIHPVTLWGGLLIVILFSTAIQIGSHPLWIDLVQPIIR